MRTETLVIPARWYERVGSFVGARLEDIGDEIAMAGTALRTIARRRVIESAARDMKTEYRVDDCGAWSVVVR